MTMATNNTKIAYNGFIYEAIYEEITPPTSSNFKSWFGNSKVTWPNGEPRIVYHGTTNDFSSFDMNFTREGNNVGKGFYFTSSPYDAGGHYGCELGPDTKSHREQFIYSKLNDVLYDIMNNNDIEELKNEILKEYTKDQVNTIINIKQKNTPKTGATNMSNITLRVKLEEYFKDIIGKEFDNRYRKNCGNIMPVYLKMENPFIIGSKNESKFYVTCEETDPEDEDTIGEINGKALELIEIFNKYGLEISDEWDLCDEVITARDIINQLRTNHNSSIVADNEGEGEMLKQIITWLDYDGIIDTTVALKFSGMPHLEEGDIHYVVFNPYQIKSVFNSGNWNPNDSDITLEEVTV